MNLRPSRKRLYITLAILAAVAAALYVLHAYGEAMGAIGHAG